MLLAMIPGVGAMYAGKNRLGRQIFALSVASVVLAVLTFRTPLADLLAYGVLGMSVWSVYTAIEAMRRKRGSHIGQMQRLGIIMLVVCAYFSVYTVARLAVDPYYAIVRIAVTPEVLPLSAGDNLLLRRNVVPHRGDIVIGNLSAGDETVTSLGPIIGLPGDRITVSDRIYVNGVPSEVVLPAPNIEDEGRTHITESFVDLGPNQYWMMPVLGGNARDVVAIAAAGTVNRNDVWGKVTAVLGPPSHRRLVGHIRSLRE